MWFNVSIFPFFIMQFTVCKVSDIPATDSRTIKLFIVFVSHLKDILQRIEPLQITTFCSWNVSKIFPGDMRNHIYFCYWRIFDFFFYNRAVKSCKQCRYLQFFRCKVINFSVDWNTTIRVEANMLSGSGCRSGAGWGRWVERIAWERQVNFL